MVRDFKRTNKRITNTGEVILNSSYSYRRNRKIKRVIEDRVTGHHYLIILELFINVLQLPSIIRKKVVFLVSRDELKISPLPSVNLFFRCLFSLTYFRV